jgi:zinc protease
MITLPTVLLLATTAVDAGVPPAPPPRAAEAILADYARAIGGERAWRRHRNLYSKRTMVAKGMEISGTEERYATSAGKVLAVSDMTGLGRFRQGSDGRVRWSDDPINGLRILSGAEEEEARIDATWNGEVQLARSYEKVRSVPPPVPPPAGHRYECVELVPRTAAAAITCFDAETHLRVLQQGTHAGPQGAVPYLTRFSDWREVQGIKMPFSEETTAGALTLEGRVVEVKLDGRVDPRMFAVPRAPAASTRGH